MSMTPPAAPLLELRGVTKRFGASRALAGVHFSLRRGEIHALCGENGAGKSTLMKVIDGIHQPDAGDYMTLASFFKRRAARGMLPAGVTVLPYRGTGEHSTPGDGATKRWVA